MDAQIKKAIDYASEKHKYQKYNGKKFIVHPLLVFSLIERVSPNDTDLQIASILHDTIEDCNVSYEELVEKFGAGVANLVREVTKDENNDFPNLSTIRGLVLKAADNFANCSNIENMEDKEKQMKLFIKYGTMYKHAGSNLKRWKERSE